MGCFISQQIATHADADCQCEDEVNEKAVIDLFNDSKGEFSNGFIELEDVVKRAVLDDDSFVTEVVVEIVKSQSEKTQNSLRKLLKKRFIATALEMNKESGE